MQHYSVGRSVAVWNMSVRDSIQYDLSIPALFQTLVSSSQSHCPNAKQIMIYFILYSRHELLQSSSPRRITFSCLAWFCLRSVYFQCSVLFRVPLLRICSQDVHCVEAKPSLSSFRSLDSPVLPVSFITHPYGWHWCEASGELPQPARGVVRN